MKKLLCMLLAMACLLALVACDSGTESNETEPSTTPATEKVLVTQPDGYALYEKYGVVFAYPEAWTKTDASVAIVQDSSDSGNNITVVSEPKNAMYDSMTLESYNETMVPVYEAMGCVITDVKVEHVTNDHGLKLLAISFTNTMSGVTMKQTQYVATIGDTSVTVTATFVKGDDAFVGVMYETLRAK